MLNDYYLIRTTLNEIVKISVSENVSRTSTIFLYCVFFENGPHPIDTEFLLQEIDGSAYFNEYGYVGKYVNGHVCGDFVKSRITCYL